MDVCPALQAEPSQWEEEKKTLNGLLRVRNAVPLHKRAGAGEERENSRRRGRL